MTLIEILMAIDEQPSGPNKIKWASKFLVEMGVDIALLYKCLEVANIIHRTTL